MRIPAKELFNKGDCAAPFDGRSLCDCDRTALEQELKRTTLADCMQKMKIEIDKE